ncbi:MAG: hypothetical protein ABIH64_07590, partial [Nanoarchaeota archaeon]
MSLKNKKAQGLPLEIIIIALVVLIVAVVLIFIFKGESNKFVKSSSCSAREGVCLNGKGDCPDGKPIKIYTSDCVEAEKKEDADTYTPTKQKDKDGKPTEKNVGSPGQCC